MIVRGIRGAITVEHNETESIHQATRELLLTIMEENLITPEQIASCFITVTPDLDATFPAQAVRAMDGWDIIPLMCALEVPVPGSLPKCIRLLLHVNTVKTQEEIRHIYLREAEGLRPDLKQKG
ncbi:chorismate mutase [Tumebacillus algifaecis]|uniref:chorismate mutase n=1 Tax=Tumebacillus algifaecis TaxID=1214604 RepID=A0A223D6T2_9BACL|nr:chorismate mutase [Tumebacillus algifaecis]ASS77197.1 chorismate mutase [Tumebacillus algifaecis]